MLLSENKYDDDDLELLPFTHSIS